MKLDGLLLALSTAGAYLEHVTTSFAGYLRLYDESWLELHTTSPSLSSYEDRSLYTTWQVTFNRIQKQNPASAQLLKLWAYLDKQDVWYGLLRHARSTDNERIQELTKDELSFNKAIRLLCEYGLAHPELSLEQSTGSAGYGMHSCVHSWTRFVLNSEWDENLAWLALSCVASEVPTTEMDEWWLLQQRLVQHAASCERLIRGDNAFTEGKEWALHNLGSLYVDQGKLADAEAMYTRALQGYEEALGLKHITTLNTVNNIGVLYADQGKLAEAEAMYTRALQGHEEALGLKHTTTLNTINNLGNLYVKQGKLADAEAMYTRALQGYEEALGLKHTTTLNTVNNLGSLYVKQGKLADAEAMYTRALQGYENALGPALLLSYLPALNTMLSFGDLFSQTGRKDAAEEMYTRALAGFTAVHGPSSKWCKQLEDRLQAMQVAFVEPDECQDESTETGATKSKSVKRRRLNEE